MASEYSRREFIKTTGAITLGAATVLGNRTGLAANQKMAPSDTVQIGVIGTGSRAQHLIQNFLTVPGVNIRAVCDIYEPNLKKGLGLSGGEKTESFTDYRKLLEDKEIDAVLVATPLHLHAEMSIASMEAGKDVLCEKSLALTIEECYQIMESVNKTGRVFQIAHQRRYMPRYQRIAQIIDEGVIGKIVAIRAQWHRNEDWRRSIPDPSLEKLRNWRLYRQFSGGLMTELCSHQLHIANWVLKEHPISVVGFGGIDFYKDGREVYDNVHAVFNYPCGVRFSYTSFTTNGHYGCSEQIMGEKGTIEITTAKATLFMEKPKPRPAFKAFVTNVERELFKSVNIGTASFLPEEGGMDPGTEIDVLQDKDDTYYELTAFANHVRNRERPLCDVVEGFDTTVAVLMANEAMEKQEIVMWPSHLRA